MTPSSDDQESPFDDDEFWEMLDQWSAAQHEASDAGDAPTFSADFWEIVCQRAEQVRRMRLNELPSREDLVCAEDAGDAPTFSADFWKVVARRAERVRRMRLNELPSREDLVCAEDAGESVGDQVDERPKKETEFDRAPIQAMGTQVADHRPRATHLGRGILALALGSSLGPSSTVTDTAEIQSIPGYVAGTWAIDGTHSDVSFTIRHMMVSKVRGRFGTVEGRIETGENPLDSTVSATIDMSSIDTGNADRDSHIRSADFFSVETHPTMTFQSSSVSASEDSYTVEGDLTLHGVTKRVTLNVEVNGFGPDSWGGTRAGFTATTEISRKEFGIDFNMPLDGGGVVLGDKIQVTLEIEAALIPWIGPRAPAP